MGLTCSLRISGSHNASVTGSEINAVKHLSQETRAREANENESTREAPEKTIRAKKSRCTLERINTRASHDARAAAQSNMCASTRNTIPSEQDGFRTT